MKFRRFSAFFLALLLAVLCVLPVGAVAEGCTQETNVTTILFTHDLHSHFLPQPTAEGGESGGYARLKTVIDGERAMNPDALLVDGGDFSIGSLIQTLYTTQAAELRTMGAMGYDAVTIGNHEFDHKGTGFAEMLNSAKAAQQAAVELLLVDARPLEDMDAYKERFGPVTPVLPTLLEANYAPADDNPDRAFIRSAMENYGVTDCMTLERGGVTYGLFGLMGVDSDECAPTSGFTRTDAAKAAKRCVETLKGEGAEIIVCLSHSGTGDSLASSEDEELAKAVDGIDVIVSGHTHSTLAEPLVVNDTYIVSSGPYCQNLGSLTFSWDDGGEKRLLDWIAATRRPMICAGDEVSDPDMPGVFFDFTRGIGDAIDYLGKQRKCRRIGFIGHIEAWINPGMLQKFHAYLHAVQRYMQMDRALIEGCWPKPGNGRTAVRNLLVRTRPDALLVASDLLIPEIAAELEAQGIRIPLVGCDGLRLEKVPDDYRTISAARRECGRRAARLLLDAMDGKLTGKIGRHAIEAEFR